jgi:DNA-directed RNA polymerase subunit RPC12/RpoP
LLHCSPTRRRHYHPTRSPNQKKFGVVSVNTLHYPCTSCGAKLEFAPGKDALKCPYCGAENSIPEATTESVIVAVEELDYPSYLAKAAGNEAQIERQTIKCPSCGASSQLPENVTADRCPFCAVPLIAADAYAHRAIKPHALAPFEIADSDARSRFRKWITGLWFAPNVLKKSYREASGLKGIYLPYWTYDAETNTPYSGQRGDHYYVTENYMENGQARSRQVQHTRWSRAAGSVQVSFDDIRVPATSSLPDDYLAKLEPWQLEKLQPYREDYLSGFTVEAYQLGLEPGFGLACKQMDAPIRSAIEGDIGGDEQRIESMSPRYSDITFKHILLPIWLSTYQYGGKTWRFLVNGQTGEVQGERPWSAWKIAFATVLALALLFLVFVFFNNQ